MRRTAFFQLLPLMTLLALLLGLLGGCNSKPVLRSTPADVRVREANNLEAEVLLKRLREPRGAPDEIEVSPEMIQRWTSASKDGPAS